MEKKQKQKPRFSEALIQLIRHLCSFDSHVKTTERETSSNQTGFDDPEIKKSMKSFDNGANH